MIDNCQIKLLLRDMEEKFSQFRYDSVIILLLLFYDSNLQLQKAAFRGLMRCTFTT